jgi:hypothetical protein
MIRTMLAAGIAIASVAAMSVATPAHADWRWRNGPHGWVRFWVAPAVVVAGPPVYYAPPVVYAPPPVYYAPPVAVFVPPVVVGVRIR